MAIRTATAEWDGTFSDGGGSVALGSGAFEGSYSAESRFEEGQGTNPEELLGAAHAGCFTMALSLALTDAGTPPEHLDTDARVSLVKDDERGGFTVNKIELRTRGRVPGIDQAGFEQAAQAAKDGCPISKALAVPNISVEATLEGA